jgi:tRNA (mo5U34)-methyltransferase
MIDFSGFLRDTEAIPPLHAWARMLAADKNIIERQNNGNVPRWLTALQQLPPINTQHFRFNSDTIEIGEHNDTDETIRQKIESLLREFHPWRKGPYRLHDIFIDTEWRSDWKWQRLQPHISPLHDRVVLDIGCGNGYHCWRMLGDGARLVVGVDPFLLFFMQFLAIKHFVGETPVHVLPLGADDIPENLGIFDTVFSMGVLYHRRSPIDHLGQLKSCLRPKGELVLETLVVEGDERTVLVPHDRYAKMRNVWFIPSTAALNLWLDRAGFTDIRLVDVNRTSLQEQRRTSWMHFESLADYLDPSNPDHTAEGYPAPTRAIFVARVP